MAGGSEGVEEEGDGALTTGTSKIKSAKMSASANAALFMSTKPLSCLILGCLRGKSVFIRFS
jgi:hypothetical protein